MKILALAFLCSAAALVAPASASAGTTKTFGAEGCIGTNKPTDDLFLIKDSSGKYINRKTNYIYNPSANEISIVCPIAKQSSGPGILIGDTISAITIGVTPAGSTLTCTMNIWRTDPINSGGVISNLVYTYSTSSFRTGTMAIRPTFGIDSFWGNYSEDPNAPTWEYADMTCVLPSHASISTYVVEEGGNQQPTQIFPASNCKPDVATKDSTGSWRYQGDQQGAIFFAGSAADKTFVFRCPVPNNVSVEFAAIPSTTGAKGDQALGCNLDALPFSGFTWPTIYHPGNHNTDVQVLPLTGQPSILIPATGTHELICGQKYGGDGDGTIYAYRTTPPLSRGWAVSAVPSSTTDVPANAIDNNTSSRWTTGKAQAADQYFQINLKSVQTIRQVVMSSGSSQDYARGYKILLSTTDSGWANRTPVASGNGQLGTTAVRFPATQAQYIRIVQTKSNATTSWWSIHDLNVYK